MNRKQKIGVGLLLVGSNALTAITMAVGATSLMRKEEDQQKALFKNLKLYQKALDRFARESPIEVAKPIIEDMAFDWTVRDLVP